MTVSSAERRPAALWWLPALRTPAVAELWSLAQWQQVLRQARRLRLLGRLAESAAFSGVIHQLPPEVQRHLVAALRASRWQTGTLVWGLERVGSVLAEAPYAKVLLKGAAYIGQDLPISRGRLPSDIDILVPQAAIADAQARLVDAGWHPPELDAHDQRYYQAWSHEAPPMRHQAIRMELDLHHNILPPVGHVRIDVGVLLERLQPCGWPGWQVLHPADQVLHSAAHLFYDSELRGRLRDLVDLDGLLRHFAVTPAFWSELQQRAHQLGLVEPLALALRLCAEWLATPVPETVLHEAEAAGLNRLQQVLLLPLLRSVLLPTAADRPDPMGQAVAAAILLLRHHRRRLPLRLLLPHVLHKLQRAQRAEN